jgi:sugar lactone lactonase YvrE
MSRARLALSIAVAVLLLLLIGLSIVFLRLLTPSGTPMFQPSSTAGVEWVRSLYGFGPTADEQLLSPSSVAIAPNGEIFVTDPIRARVMVFGPDGGFRRLLHTGGGGVGPGQFARPESIAIDRAGQVYIADSWAKKIIVFDRRGRFVREWPVQKQARGVSVSADKVYVLDVGKVLVFDKRGKLLSEFGQRGPGPGQIDAYQGIVARGGTIYVADSYNKRIQAFDEQGKLKWVMPDGAASRVGPSVQHMAEKADGSGTGQAADHAWQLPQDLIFDGYGRLIVVDAFAFQIDVVDPATGKVTNAYGEYGQADGQLFYPTSIAYDASRDWFAIADTQNNRVQIVRIPGSGPAGASLGWRALSSPYRYVLIPLLLLLITIAITWYSYRRLTRGSAEQTTAEEPSNELWANGEVSGDE